VTLVDDEIKRLLSETVEALEAILVAVQLEPQSPGSDYALNEAVRRINHLRRNVEMPDQLEFSPWLTSEG
jgi:hypothetical protein